MPVGIVTGASRGLGLALTKTLAGRGWTVVVDARGGDVLQSAAAGLDRVVPVAGCVPGRGHLRPAAARGERAGPPRADRGLPPERPLPGAGAGVSALETAVRLEAHEPPEVRGRGRDDVALLVASRHDGRLVHAA